MSFTRYIPQDPRQRQAERNARNAAVAEQVRRAQKPSISMGGRTSGVAIAKEEKARPGRRTPTKAEREWMDAIVRFGCIACWIDGNAPRPTAVHHLLRGGRRIGHLHTFGLCDPGHHQNGAQFGMVSRHPYKAAFEAKYGTEAELLARLRAEIGVKA